jgi:hypothetical protein
LKMSSHPSVDGQSTNHYSFGRVNKNFTWFVTDFTISTNSPLNLHHLLFPRIFQKKSSKR